MSHDPGYPPADPSQPGPLSRAAAAALLERADALGAQGEYEGAAATYGRVVGHADADLHVAALLGLADARYRLDDEPGALQSWIVATQAPETALTWRAWKQLAGARVRSSDLVGAARAYREAERRAPAEERPEIASRLGWLNREMGNEGTAQRYFGRSRADGIATPLATYAILAVTIAIGVSSFFGSAPFWYGLFALDKAAVAQGEWYRLVTVVLVHDARLPLHLFFNMYALYLVGPIVEALYGRALFLLLYVATAAAASAASYVFLPGVDAVGASGAIFGLFGALFVSTRVYRPILARRARAITSQIGILIAFNLVLGFGLLGGAIDNAAHVGGLLAGGWLGLVLPPRGATTIAKLFQRPTPTVGTGAFSGGVTGAETPVARASTLVLLRLAAVAALLALVALAVLGGPRPR